MKIPQIFIPDKDLTNKINNYLEEKPSLYDYIKRVYEGLENKNIFLLYGPPATGKTFTSNKTKEALSKEYNISHINLQPIDAVDAYMATKSKYSKEIEDKIILGLSANKKVYVDIVSIEKFAQSAQEALDSILMGYKNNKNIVFVLESYYKYLSYFQDGQIIDIEFTKKRL